MPPTPKPRGQRVRRNIDQGRWKTLPAAKAFDTPPKLPQRKPAWLKATREWWKLLWASPMAVMWIAADVPALLELAVFKEHENRGVGLSGGAFTRKTQLEDRFGLSPKARRQLQWEIARAEAESPEHQGSRSRRVRAVDSRSRGARAVARS